jgi:hypothetical protein
MPNLQTQLNDCAERALHFGLKSADFESIALELFQLHVVHNPVYAEWISYLKVNPKKVDSLAKIPFFPVRFFKQFKVGIFDGPLTDTLTFASSNTTGGVPSQHFVPNPRVYEASFLKAFELFYGQPSDWTILALLPGYLERTGSSLVYMANKLIQLSNQPQSGFYLSDFEALAQVLASNLSQKKQTLLLGVSFGLLDFIESKAFLDKEWFANSSLTIMETGGMKGRRIELTRMELHEQLSKAFKVEKIHSEYGMTELLSQAYSNGDGLFQTPPWMQVLLRETDNPMAEIQHFNRVGGVNVIDLANVYSCPFLAIDDLGKRYANQTFEILGRFDQAEIRGCNLMIN